MPGKRQPTAVIKANGRKHLSKAEEAERLAHELHVPPPETVAPPKWLGKKHHAEFCQLADTLANLGLYTDLDQDVLAQYLQCRERWLNADKQAAKAIRAKDEKTAASWTGIQGSYFKQARQCAEAMGLSVTSRCRLVVPQSSGQPTEADNPFLRLIEGGAVKRA